MKRSLLFAVLAAAVFIGCEKDDDNPVDPGTNTGATFTTGNIKTRPVHFSFATKDTVAASAAWDMKLTTLYSPDDSLRQYPFPGIVLNPTTGVTGTFVDQKFDLVTASAVTGLKKDILDTVAVDSIRTSIKTSPVYYSFDLRDTVSASGNWDIKWTVNASNEPLVVLNRNKGVTGTVLEGTDFATLNTAALSLGTTDANDTTLVIGNKCFLYAGPPTHRLNPVAGRVFVVRTINGARVKFRTLSYYNAAGTSGFPKFEYAAPERYSIGTFILKYAGPPTHKLNPFTDRTFVVKTGAGAFVKFEILTYYNEAGTSGYVKFKYQIQ
ncbi:MAG: hypothetical protein F9K22_07580 [Bacteroidetes bacterium]|nr:MAG: hypothetical protein F9K22_07580 [Bacteroidota bacterium]